MKKILGHLMLFILLIASLPVLGQKKHTFEIKDGNFEYTKEEIERT